MNVAAAPFSPKTSSRLAAARLLVSSTQAELEAAKTALTELEFAENCQPCKPQLAAPVKRCTYCTGRHSNYAGIGGCTEKSPCSICGGAHKAGKRGANHARVVRALRRAASAGSDSSSASSAPASPASSGGCADQGGCNDDAFPPLAGTTPGSPTAKPAPEAVRVQSSVDKALAESQPDNPWVTVARKGAKRSASRHHRHPAKQ